ncbi:MAG: FAD-dependent oxidoreductase [Natronospirillum sp.]|uniref:NAD(P)/FAD-dependent oxidoreductase n=1 Tax=Natronospirillum sp. TaxID=2812955 RepID=UPI0025F6693C|nr:FAD-dependent oxidoreductase [Natronospirillum sp.]MCH8550930.1 FAD-dependent oxidoreductase [Natronospirillum sp.]
MVIVGAGEAGVRAAVTLRQQGWDGPVTLLGEEPHTPYERPPLSKDYLTGADRKLTSIGGTNQFEALEINFRPSVTVEAIRREDRTLITRDGETLQYEKLLLATGASARRVRIPKVPDPSILLLRSVNDSDRIRERMREGLNVVMVGGGFIGLEVAASLRSHGAIVHVLELQDELMKRAVPASIAQIIRQEHQNQGVHIHLSTRVSDVNTRHDRRMLTLSNGQTIQADMIIAGVGAAPSTGLAESAGLRIENGIAVDAGMATEDPHIFAAGDCCSFPHPLYDNNRMRLESWRCAQEQGEVAALNMLGKGETYMKAPWFWSNQFDLGLQIAGLPDQGSEEVVRQIDDRSLLHFSLRADGTLAGAAGVAPGNAIARDIKICERLINGGSKPDPAVLSDPGAPLKPLLQAG